MEVQTATEQYARNASRVGAAQVSWWEVAAAKPHQQSCPVMSLPVGGGAGTS